MADQYNMEQAPRAHSIFQVEISVFISNNYSAVLPMTDLAAEQLSK